MSAEKLRLQEDLERKRHWRRWGPYLSERQWGTVREDYDSRGDVWFSFTHDMARSRAYRWGEDGIGGLSDNHQQLCFAFTFWNGVDPILKERLFGLAGPEGNHGEDVKEYYFHLDNTPTHSYMHYLYKYPQGVFPYEELVQKNGARGLNEGEFELLDTQAFTQNRYYDIAIEYAKSGPEDVFIRVTAANRGPEAKKLHILPTLWFRKQKKIKPNLSVKGHFLEAVHSDLGRYFFYYPTPNDILFTDNETNTQKLYGTPNQTPYVKDAFHDYLIHGKKRQLILKKWGQKQRQSMSLTSLPKRAPLWSFGCARKRGS